MVMQTELPALSVDESLISLLQRCRQKKNLQEARRLHAHICRHELESHPIIGSCLVSTLAECGSLAEAQCVFDRLPLRTERSWTSLIAGYARSSDPNHAFHLYHQMQLQDLVQPSRYTLIALFASCASLNIPDHGRALHADIVLRGLDSDLYLGTAVLGNALLYMYMKCGFLVEARLVFNGLPVRDLVSWNTIIASYAENGLLFGEEEGSSFQQMQWEGVSPDSVTFVCSLKCCTVTGNIDAGREVHAEITKRGLERELYVGNTLLDMYGNFGWLAEAEQVFAWMPVRDVVSWAALISGYAEHELVDEPRSCFLQEMKLDGIAPDSVIYLCCLKLCGALSDLGKGQEVHAEVIKMGLENDVLIGNTLVNLYNKSSLLAEARQVFDSMPTHDAISWKLLLAGYADHEFDEELLIFVKQAKLQHASADVSTYAGILKVCCSIEAFDIGCELHSELTRRGWETDLCVVRALVDLYTKGGLLAEALKVFKELRVPDIFAWVAIVAGQIEYGLDGDQLTLFQQFKLEDIPEDPHVFVSGLKACGSATALETGQRMHAEAIKRGLERDLYVGSALVHMYMQCGNIEEALQVFEYLPVQNVVTWNALISGYTECGHGVEAANCFYQLQLEGICPDPVTFMCCLKACGLTGAIETGQEIHAAVVYRGLERELYIANTLVDIYGKCGSFAEAHKVFDGLPLRDAVSWNALIAGYAEQGRADDAQKCCEQMLLEGLPTDAVPYIYCLKACGSMGTLESGLAKETELGLVIHAKIVIRGLESLLHVGNAIMGMYGSCGLVAETGHVFERLENRDVVSWAAVIVAYNKQGLNEKVCHCFQQMQWEGICPDSVTSVRILKACVASGDLDTGRRMHGELASKGLEADANVGNALVNLYGKCGLVAEAQQVFDSLLIKDIVAWNTLIAGYTELDLDEEVLHCFRQMQLQSVSLDSATCVLCLKACGTAGALQTGQELDAEIRKLGLETDLFVGIVLIDMYCKNGLVVEGRKVFDKLPVRNVISWNTMIKAYGENHEADMALQCFEDMQHQGVKPNSITFTCLLTACSHASLVVEGQKYFEVMRNKYGIEPMLDHYGSMVDLFVRSGHVDKGERFVSVLQSRPCFVTLIALLSAHKLYGQVEHGERCFQHLVEVNQEDASAYSLMADVYSSVGRWSDAGRLEKLRTDAEAKKKGGCASIEVNKKLHEFMVGDKHNHCNEELTQNLDFVILHMRIKGYLPDLDLVSEHGDEVEKHATFFVNKQFPVYLPANENTIVSCVT